MSNLPRREGMKRAISVACVFLISSAFMLCSSALAENESRTAGEGIVLEFELEKPILVDGLQIMDTAYERITIPGLAIRNIPGEPAVPFKTVNVLIPYGEEVLEVRVIPGDEEYLGKMRIEPAQEQLPISDMSISNTTGETKEPTPPNAAIYSSFEPFPKSAYLVSGVQSKQGFMLLPVTLYPIKYIPSTMDTYYFGSFKIEVTTKTSEKLDSGIFRGLEKDREMVAELVGNPKEMDTYSVGVTLGASPLLTGPYDYVIITNEALKNCTGPNNFQALASWKNSRGVSTAIVTVEEIYFKMNTPQLAAVGMVKKST